MTPFDIRIPVILFKSFDPMMTEALTRKFSSYILNKYVEGAMKELDHDSRYLKQWESKAEDFRDYMKSKGLPETISLDAAAIKSAFRLKKYKSYYMLEFSPILRVRGRKSSLLAYMRLVEFGTSKFPARYLMTPVRRDLELNMKYYWEEFYSTEIEGNSHYRKKTHYEQYLERRSAR